MAEIKSTLDIVMEKTKHLTLTKEEKEEQVKKEVEKGVAGLLQKYLDQLLNAKQVNEEMKKLEERHGFSCQDILLKETLDRIELDKDNTRPLFLLTEVFGRDVGICVHIIEGYEKTLKRVADNRKHILKQNLKKRHSISGEAVVTNLEADNKWIEDAEVIRTKFEKDLATEKKKLARL